MLVLYKEKESKEGKLVSTILPSNADLLSVRFGRGLRNLEAGSTPTEASGLLWEGKVEVWAGRLLRDRISGQCEDDKECLHPVNLLQRLRHMEH